MWVTFYKPAPTAPTASSTSSSVRRTTMLAGLGSAAAAQGGHSALDPLDVWLAAGLILDGSEPINPLKWWIQQKRSRNTHGGLLQMALDVLSCQALGFEEAPALSQIDQQGNDHGILFEEWKDQTGNLG
ncbi:hypothetical protein PSTG_02272 [Puccinia striiformis f. sp. tritici PST-78]|uniref:HAT C-terminal dimerisation domain-containing protein n=1 Tax=Puccinia striiformis f. sp. tritici PST-78 TaxID=1165861 RepID=A0A0L0VYS9_9BASI|nr:hypothetical protein PSTG_02272 [Puccinia striiformis f. sp. tritici PST-78]